MWGMVSAGSDDGMPPNFVPMVSTGIPKTLTAKVPSTNAMILPGMRCRNFILVALAAFAQPATMASDIRLRNVVVPSMVSRVQVANA
jgi:hypothetical protein